MPAPGVIGSVTSRPGGFFTSSARTQLSHTNCVAGPHALGIVVVDYHTTEELRLFVQSLLDSAPQLPYALVIESVDATDDEALLASELATLVSDFALSAANTVHSSNVGYARACNDGAHLLSLYDEFDTYAFFNSDTRIREGVLESCVELLWKDPSYGVLGPRQVDENENITSAGIFGTLSKPEMRYWHRPAGNLGMDIRDDAVSVSGSAYFVKKHVFDELTDCPIYQESDPGSPGAFLQTPLYYEETFCIPKGEFVWTENGPTEIENVQPGTSVWSFSQDAGEIVYSRSLGSVFSGTKRCLKLVAEGRTISVSEDHEIPVLAASQNKNLLTGATGELLWKKAKDIDVGDYLLKVVGVIEDSWEIPDGVTEDAMHFFGAYLGNGCLDERAIHMSFPADHRFNTVEGVEWMKELGFHGRAWEKRIPAWAFRTPRSYRLRMLGGLIDSDGHVNKKGAGSYTSTSRGLIEDIVQLAASCGISASAASLTEGSDAVFPGYVSHGRDHWTTHFSAPSEIPFSDSLYRDRVRDSNRRKDGHTLSGRAGLGESIRASRVSRIEDLGDLPVYDISVPETETFVVAGVPVHNCSYHANAHDYKVVYNGEATMVHRWHKSISKHGDNHWFSVSKEMFVAACDHHGIEHD